MINERISIDEAFRIYAKQFDMLDKAKAKIKEFPFNEYLHVGFDSGLAKETTFVYNLEYRLPFQLNDTKFTGWAKGLNDISVPTEWVKGHLREKNPRLSLGFKLTYRSDTNQWSIKCSSAWIPLVCNSKYTVGSNEYYVRPSDEYSVLKEVNTVLGYAANSRSKAAVARKSNDVNFYIKMFQLLLPFVMTDNLIGIRRVLSDASNTKAINTLK